MALYVGFCYAFSLVWSRRSHLGRIGPTRQEMYTHPRMPLPTQTGRLTFPNVDMSLIRVVAACCIRVRAICGCNSTLVFPYGLASAYKDMRANSVCKLVAAVESHPLGLEDFPVGCKDISKV
ncbi:uncharacterized protein LY79DRAFT_287326 [Colletotrichum navitas]|uniref:Uncharacterized protein n=1 Tax=Colletotrichum navitas TaxID=681940 RepID=A0AAD8Q9U3_9PEZI|nr:uncharacterized protein LY79DRAFT_287326 [Colletotrichum navitas]KAK1598375.1 hypothetical protein LY79DRAFT_287326 [Colletotrichum navitas]